MKSRVIVTQDNTGTFQDIIAKFKKDKVLVGIPGEKTTRKTDEAEVINNATLLAINEFGSPINNIPARPVMQNGIRNAQDRIAEIYGQAAKAALSSDTLIGNRGEVDMYYERAGITASNSIKKAINAQDFEGGGPGSEGPADATLEARRRAGFKGTKSLIVTGQMRNAITYVVKS